MKQSNARANTKERTKGLNLKEKWRSDSPPKSGKAAIYFRLENIIEVTRTRGNN